MAITYRTTGTWGSGKGSPLTSEEVDENFWWIVEQLADFDAYLPAAVNEIVNVTFVGTQLTFFMSDGTEWGPFTIPTHSQYQAADITEVTGTSRTLLIGDAQRYLRCTNAAGCLITIPPSSSVNFSTKTEVHFRQAGAGPLVFSAGVGVTLNGIDGYELSTIKQGAVATVKKIDTDEWDLFGLLTPEAASS